MRALSSKMVLSRTSSAMMLPFLRPMGLPRASTISRFLGAPRLSSTANSTATVTTAVETPLPIASSSKPYRITLTPSKQYPVYTLKKRGGNMKLTKLRRIEGDLNTLRTELQEALGLEEKEVVINQLTKHIIVKGHKKPEIINFLKERSL